MSRTILRSLIILPLFASTISATCYLPDGTLAPGAYRCNNSTSGHSTCCEIGSICWSNGVCQKQTNGITDWIRLGCTDPTWNDAACLHACMDITHNALGVRPCDGIGGTNYCCDLRPGDPGNMSCCATSAQVFSVRAATVEATVPLDGKAVSTTSGSSATSSMAMTSSSSMSTSTFASLASTSNAASSTSSRPASTSTGSSSSSGLSTGAQAGIGVGVAAGVLGAAAIGFLLWRRRKAAATGYNTASTNSSGNNPSDWRGEQAYAAQQQNGGGWTVEQKPYGQQGYGGNGQMQQAWTPVTPATQPAGELESREKPVELNGNSAFHEMESPRSASRY